MTPEMKTQLTDLKGKLSAALDTVDTLLSAGDAPDPAGKPGMPSYMPGAAKPAPAPFS